MAKTFLPDNLGVTVKGWEVGAKIAGGNTCKVYLGQRTHRPDGSSQQGDEVAVKVVRDDDKLGLEDEYNVLRDFQGNASVPQPFWFGWGAGYQFIVMERGGQSLRRLLDLCGGRFTISTILRLAEMLLDELEKIHSHGYLHRSIKPDNIIMSMDGHRVVFIDFETATRYRTDSGKHFSFKSDQGIRGTHRYASPGSHKGYRISRRDDCQSLIYTLMELRDGGLPWDKVTDLNEMLAAKKSTLKGMCERTDEGFGWMQNRILHLQFSERPPYNAFRRRLEAMYEECNANGDASFDWEGRQLRNYGGYSCSGS